MPQTSDRGAEKINMFNSSPNYMEPNSDLHNGSHPKKHNKKNTTCDCIKKQLQSINTVLRFIYYINTENTNAAF